ncbi:tubulin monoglutamylase TTLL4-like [Apis cerana]|uniref:Tubulin polyglutamylase TTLL4 n=1 Tax=Apis cerana cerana TaxID=94128 RepID=A0A2A3EK96_APICC|nr:tubulin monoglutamylase TTLL4-like [Apis cerana]XP_061928580.1 tubulin monoglutamylase TTLL4-like [Apis cerana]XP_061928581.1 tubulin monoglutamylase TTLL4-like [Apis cerana]PBC32195.1 Tubulin polyglutamylase TTLL4 [Apis cerana cerana]
MHGDFDHPNTQDLENTSNRCATTSTSNGMINLNFDEEWLTYEKLTEIFLFQTISKAKLTDPRPVRLCKTIQQQAKSVDVLRHVRQSSKLAKNKVVALKNANQPVIFDKRADGDKARDVAPIPMRKSLFPYVSPYVLFQSHDHVPTKKLPRDFVQLFKWKFTSSMPRILIRILVNSGYEVVNKGSDWSAVWNLSSKDVMRFRRMKPFQKVNNMPGSHNIGDKDLLWTHLNKMSKKFGSDYNFMPRTYILPKEIQKFESMWSRHGIGTTWIIKPPSAGRGQGIKIVNQWWEIPKWHSVIIQRYITKPKLINGLKFDLRIYVLLTSINPLRIYIYQEGLVRFASVRYIRGSNLNDKYMHLTNSSVNKQNPAYVMNDGVNSFKGHKWSFSSLWSYLKQEDVNVSELWSLIKNIIIKTFVAVESSMNAAISENLVSSYSCYELYGFDVLLDESLRPWLLEVNILPSLQTDSPLDTSIKGTLVKNVLNMAGYQIPKNEQVSSNGISNKKYDSIAHNYKLYSTALNLQEKTKQNEINAIETRDEYLAIILENLTRDDIRQLIRYEDELSQVENFEKIFPTKNSYCYFKFFEVKRYYDRLLDAWENRYSDNRMEGIRRLQRYCENMQHLDQND